MNVILAELATKTETNADQIAALTAQVSKLADQVAALSTAVQVSNTTVTALAERVAVLERSAERGDERYRQNTFTLGNNAIGWLFGGIGLIISFISLIVLFSTHWK